MKNPFEKIALSAVIATATALAFSGSARACSEDIRFSSSEPEAPGSTTETVQFRINQRTLTVTDDDGVFMTMLAYQYAAYAPIDPGGKVSVVDESPGDWAKTKTKPFTPWKGPLGQALRDSMARTEKYFESRIKDHPEEQPNLDRVKKALLSVSGKDSITYEDLSKIGEYLDEEAPLHGYDVKEGEKKGYYMLMENSSENPLGSSFGNFFPLKFPPTAFSRCATNFPGSFEDAVAVGGSGKSGSGSGSAGAAGSKTGRSGN